MLSDAVASRQNQMIGSELRNTSSLVVVIATALQGLRIWGSWSASMI